MGRRSWRLAAAAMLVLAGCGGGGGGSAASGPPANVAGVWEVTETLTLASNTCLEEGEEIYQILVTQDDSDITVDTPAGTFSGQINGNKISWTGSYPDDDGTTTITGMNITVNGDTFGGTTTWNWTGPGGSCGGSTSVTGERIAS